MRATLITYAGVELLWPSLGAALSVKPWPPVAVRPSVRPVLPIFSKQKSHSNF